MNAMELVRQYDLLAKDAHDKKGSNRSSFSRYSHYSKKEWAMADLAHKHFLELNESDQAKLRTESLTSAIYGCFNLTLPND